MSRQFELLFQFAQQTRPDQIEEFARALWSDYLRSGRNDRPDYLAPFDLPDPPQVSRRSRAGAGTPVAPSPDSHRKGITLVRLTPIVTLGILLKVCVERGSV